MELGAIFGSGVTVAVGAGATAAGGVVTTAAPPTVGDCANISSLSCGGGVERDGSVEGSGGGVDGSGGGVDGSGGGVDGNFGEGGEGAAGETESLDV